METAELKRMVDESTKDLPAVKSVNISEEKPEILIIEVQNFLPDQEDKSWGMFAMHDKEWTHPVFKTTQPCIELYFPLGNFDPSTNIYFDKIAYFSLPWIDHQRLFPGPSFSWEPSEGNLKVSGKVFNNGQTDKMLAKELYDMISNLIGLVYYATAKKWEMNVEKSLGKMAEPIVLQVRNKMNSLLGLTPDEEDAAEEEDSID